jgi:hypothetical protein
VEISKLRNLTSLDLETFDGIPPAVDFGYQNFTTLSSLSISWFDIDLSSLPDTLISLTYLPRHVPDPNSVERLRRLTNLTRLRVSTCLLEFMNDFLIPLTKLEHVSLLTESGIDIGDLKLRLPPLPCLKKLTLPQKVTEDTFSADFPNLVALSTRDKLNLGSGLIFSRLQSLTCGRFSEPLSEMINLTKLKILTFDRTAWFQVADLSKLTNLRELSLPYRLLLNENLIDAFNFFQKLEKFYTT